MLKPIRLSILRVFALGLTLLVLPASLPAQSDEPAHPLSEIPLRLIGPALTSGRVSDFAIHPTRPEVIYVAMASGGVWKTENHGTTWSPVFNKEGSYATGVVVLDPRDPDTVWVGTGENNAQRSVGYGDGVYRSRDGGKSWTHMGLKDSAHISMIRFHPGEADIIYVAAQGPLWNTGGERGLYRSTNAGQTWERILHVDDDTGVNEFVIHPDDPDVIVASTYQRRRHVWTLINGGPGSGIHKSNDGGATWRKISSGIPGGATWRKISSGIPDGDLGRIGLTSAPGKPDTLYAIIEASEEDQGVYRSLDFGESWDKRSSHMTASPQYYNELVVDPNDADVVYSLDTLTNVSRDGGETWSQLSLQYRHVDDHALWIDPQDSNHMYIGGDGGMYMSWDGGKLWTHVRNLPATQFYRVTPDNAAPFYNVCGGTQDNHTLCGPVRTRFDDGITNADWWIAKFGDGYKARFDPDNPNIIYAQAQYGSLVRFDKITGEKLTITPQPGADENQYRWNWNSPLILSPHDSRRLYYAAERVFRSEDRGLSWTTVSGDLSRNLDRNALEVMGRVWSVDAIAKNDSTSMYGSIIALDESPLQEGLLYVGTDDGLIQVSEDGGENWRQVSSIPGVPDMSLIEDIIASRHDVDVAYAAVDNHKRGDHRPYVLKTTDRGRNWTLISNNLPANGTVHTLMEDHVDPGLLFAGSEFGVYFSNNGGDRWHELTDLPTISVRDLEIQRRENDLVIGTFGRGIYILDDYSPLRSTNQPDDSAATLFPVRDSWLFVPDARRGWGGLGDYGSARYSAENPPHGAVISYYLPEALKTLREQRREQEKERAETGEDNPYPAWDRLRAEDREEAPALILTVRDDGGDVVRRIAAPSDKGFHRVAWDLRYPAPDPVSLEEPGWRAPWTSAPRGPFALPGTYSVTLSQRVGGEWRDVAGPEAIVVKPMFEGGLVTDDRQALLEFQRETASLYRAVEGAERSADELRTRIDHVMAAIDATPSVGQGLASEVRRLRSRAQDIDMKISGDRTVSSRNEASPMPLTTRISNIVNGTWESQSAPGENFRASSAIAEQQLRAVLADLESLDGDLGALESELDSRGAPWTPGRIPDLQE